jgi:photosystem II stability/assembly factor-like uncharacterized protein
MRIGSWLAAFVVLATSAVVHAEGAPRAASGWVDISQKVLDGLAREGKKVAWPGKTAGVAVDRVTGDVFMVVPDQGIWKSSDRGATFARADRGQIGGRCETGFALNFDPRGKRLACFMLDGASGYTLDGGATWEGMKQNGRGWDACSVDWSAEKPADIFALRHESGGEIFSSSDMGKSWKFLGNGFASAGLLTPKIFVATKEKDKGIFRSTDGGRTWEKVSDRQPGGRDIRIFDGAAYWTSAEGLLVSKDEGRTWAVQGSAVECSYGPYFGKDARQIVVVGKKGFFETRDGGQRWELAAPLPPEFTPTMPGWFSNFGWDPNANIFYASRMGMPTYKYERDSARTQARADDSPRAIPTFQCLGLYWSPPGGSADKRVEVRFRRRGESEWREGLAMRYNPIPGTDEDLADYRGSIVNLAPATTYEVRLSLAGSATEATLTAATWSEEFPIGQTVRVPDDDTPLVIKESGTPEAYRVYDGRGATIGVRHQHDQCVTINASYVILRGLTLRGAGAGEPARAKTIGAIQIEGGHDIVIEDCDISDWGRRNPETGFGRDYEAALYSRSRTLERLIVQRCKMHHPRWTCSPWDEKYRNHTQGPQCITLVDTAGNHVIRYNECYSDLDHMYNDVIGGGSNGSFRGSPGHDSDIYRNLISHCWDDGLEVEGASRNVRVWGNYITQCMMGIGNAAGSIGPLYIWDNVFGRSQRDKDAQGAHFLKMGFADGEQWMTGQMYIFNNTIFQEGQWLARGGLGGDRIVKHVTSRNNILHVRTPRDFSASQNRQNVDNDFDYDLFNGRVPQNQETHGVRGEPRYTPGAGFDTATRTGRFQLAPDSPGTGAGVAIPNFSDGYTGPAPDMGAHQRGAPPMRYGVGAKQ